METRVVRDLSHWVRCEHRCGVDRLAGELGVCRMAGPNCGREGHGPDAVFCKFCGDRL